MNTQDFNHRHPWIGQVVIAIMVALIAAAVSIFTTRMEIRGRLDEQSQNFGNAVDRRVNALEQRLDHVQETQRQRTPYFERLVILEQLVRDNQESIAELRTNMFTLRDRDRLEDRIRELELRRRSDSGEVKPR